MAILKELKLKNIYLIIPAVLAVLIVFFAAQEDEEIPELLSVSLGSNETTLLKLTTAYCSFVNGGKKVNSKMIKRIQDRRGKTIFNSENRSCSGCDFFQEKNKSPLIKIIRNSFLNKD